MSSRIGTGTAGRYASITASLEASEKTIEVRASNAAGVSNPSEFILISDCLGSKAAISTFTFACG